MGVLYYSHRLAKGINKMQEFETGAKKDLKGKLRVDLVPTEVIRSFAEVSAVGIAKGYEERNWEKGIPIEQHLAAAQRHMIEHQDGNLINEEPLLDGTKSHQMHLEHAAWHLMAAVTQLRRNKNV